ncbi:MAG TPA: hypothetical protein VF470_00410, partial [Sphingomicrobium sp.]
MTDHTRSPIVIATCGEDALEAWSELRSELWPEDSLSDHRTSAAACLQEPTRLIAFLALEEGEAVGFAEASLRVDYV